ncbi:MAG: hypothetical protein MUP13_00490 [Thermoanaerobaculales bacterium]|nr:hypothetical protein [Thermoanaerobaculales bacterium]
MRSFIHIYIYSVDISGIPDFSALVDHWTVRYSFGASEYAFSWDTTGLAPGYYDIRLVFSNGTALMFRIQLN